MTLRRFTLATMAATMLAATLPAIAAAQDELDVTPEGVLWTLTSAGETAVPAGVGANLFLEDGDAGGNTGCNSFSGSYELDGSSLTFGDDFAATQAFCEGAPGEVEQAYLAALPTVAAWSIDGPELSLSDADGAVALTFEESAVEVFETDIIALQGELNRLDQRIDNTRRDVRSLNVDNLRSRVVANEAVLAEIGTTVENQNVRGLRDRVVANEAVLKELTERQITLRQRVRDLDRRVRALEEAADLQAVPQQ